VNNPLDVPVLSSPNTCLIIARVSVALLQSFPQNLMHIRCQVHHEITSGLHQSNKTAVQMAALVLEIMDPRARARTHAHSLS
jgi:hypothetical protein